MLATHRLPRTRYPLLKGHAARDRVHAKYTTGIALTAIEKARRHDDGENKCYVDCGVGSTVGYRTQWVCGRWEDAMHATARDNESGMDDRRQREQTDRF